MIVGHPCPQHHEFRWALICGPTFSFWDPDRRILMLNKRQSSMVSLNIWQNTTEFRWAAKYGAIGDLVDGMTGIIRFHVESNKSVAAMVDREIATKSIMVSDSATIFRTDRQGISSTSAQCIARRIWPSTMGVISIPAQKDRTGQGRAQPIEGLVLLLQGQGTNNPGEYQPVRIQLFKDSWRMHGFA